MPFSGQILPSAAKCTEGPEGKAQNPAENRGQKWNFVLCYGLFQAYFSSVRMSVFFFFGFPSDRIFSSKILESRQTL